MNTPLLARLALIVSAAATLLPACSSAPPSSYSGLPSTGAVPGLFGRVGHASPPAHRAQLANVLRTLYVDDYGSNAVEVLKYRTWTNLGTITNGVNQPLSNWVDRSGNLYVADRANRDITEYDSAGNLTFTYSSGMYDPFGVTTDRFGTVYEADFSANHVSEFAQGSNYPAATCSLGKDVFGVAVDKHGDVFADYSDISGAGITEYKHGLIASSCTGTVLPVTLVGPGGMAIDTQGNLVVCDSGGAAVDIIAPPYRSITRTLGSGWAEPFNVTIDRAGTQAYVADTGALDVEVLTYPGGSTVATLDGANGLSNPTAAVDSKNYVP